MFNPEKEKRMTQPQTIVEQLDAAKNGEEFGLALGGLFATLEKLRDQEEGRG